MNEILLRVQAYLGECNRGAPGMSDDILDRAAQAFRDALDRRFNDAEKKDFTLRMSNLGRPTCQLQAQKMGMEAEDQPYNFPMKMVIGDVIEVLSMAIMEAAGIPIEAEQQPVKMELAGETIKGTYDVKLYGKIYDIKSCSKWAFNNKFSKSFKDLAESDAFGYVGQGYGYAAADGSPFGGWIAVCKETGEWSVLETPDDDEAIRKQTLASLQETLEWVNSDQPFKRCFDAEPEKFRKAPTGNYILGTECSFCEYKWGCWPGLQMLPQVVSKGQNPPYKYYTYVAPEYMEEKDV